MSFETLRGVLKNVLNYAGGYCYIAFQGGEPTLAGLDFFREAVRLADELNVNKCRIGWSIQTNGLLLDETWRAFLAENRFLVGISLDGPADIHDLNRIDSLGKGTYDRVLRSAQMLTAGGVDTNILCVVTASSAQNFQKIQSFFDRIGFEYQQYIPCLDPLNEERGTQPWSLTQEGFEQYLKTAFDCWYRDIKAGKRKYHRYFENLLFMLDGQVPEACGMMGVCSRQYVVEADGGVYPCDFYALDQYKLGNLATDSVEEIDRRREEIGFVKTSAEIHEDCRACRWFRLCRSGCRRDRDYFENGLGKNYYCRAYGAFFEYAYPRLLEVYKSVRYG